MTKPDPLTVFNHVTETLNNGAQADHGATAWAAWDWLQVNGAGYPPVPLMMEDARRDAMYWADTAHPAELECYFVASAAKLGEGSTFMTSPQIKRLIATLWQRMSPDEQSAFRRYIEKGA